MFENLNQIVNWDENLPCSQLILVESDQTNSDFILHHLISMYLKNNYSIILSTIGQSYGHYAQAGSKIGSNLDKAKSNGFLMHINIADLWLNEYIKTSTDGTELDVKSLYNIIKSNVLKLKETNLKFAFVIDDLSIFLHLGFTPNSIATFVQYLIAFCKSENAILIVQLNLFTDKQNQNLNKRLNLLAETIIKTKSLKSGFSKDVHGEITIEDKNYVIGVTIKKWSYQYKLKDKSILLFAKGTSSAVL